MPLAATLKVLIVDDQTSMRQIAQHSLSEIGVRHTIEAADGQEGFQKVLSQPVDLIISDYNMPNMDGMHLLRAVRAHQAVRKLPFILLTGRGDRELVVKAAQAGVNNYLVKPFTPEILREKIEAVVGRLV